MYKPRISCFTLSSTSNDCQVFEILHFFFLIHIPILGLFLFLLNISQFTNTTVYQTKLTHLKYNNPCFLFLNDHFIAPCYRTSVKLMKRLLGFCITNDMTWKYTDNVEKLCKLFFFKYCS